MKAFADIAIPAFVVVEIAAVIGALAVICRRVRHAIGNRRRRPRPVSLRARLRESRRLARYRLTRRMPGSCPVPDLYRLTDEDRAEFGGIAIFYREDSASQGRNERARRQP